MQAQARAMLKNLTALPKQLPSSSACSSDPSHQPVSRRTAASTNLQVQTSLIQDPASSGKSTAHEMPATETLPPAADPAHPGPGLIRPEVASKGAVNSELLCRLTTSTEVSQERAFSVRRVYAGIAAFSPAAKDGIAAVAFEETSESTGCDEYPYK